MDEAEQVRYMKDTEGWQIIQQKIDEKIQFHKDQLINCPLEEVIHHRTMIEAMKYVPSIIKEKIE